MQYMEERLMRELLRVIELVIIEAYADAKAWVLKVWDKIKVKIDD